jgi:hypothetical protein
MEHGLKILARCLITVNQMLADPVVSLSRISGSNVRGLRARPFLVTNVAR